MAAVFDILSVTARVDGVVLGPDGSSVEVSHGTIRRSTTLQDALNAALNSAAGVYIYLPRGVLQDWLQSVDALKSDATSAEHSTDIAHNPRLMQFLKV